MLSVIQVEKKAKYFQDCALCKMWELMQICRPLLQCSFVEYPHCSLSVVLWHMLFPPVVYHFFKEIILDINFGISEILEPCL